MLAAGALVASLLAVGAAPAGAAEIKTGEANTAEQSVKPTFSACVGAATEDAGFTDLGSLDAAADDINCLAHYGITVGKTADTFDPNSNVTRSQMALFLYRAAGIADLDLMGGNMMADFGDIADLGEDRQAAIKALASNGILAGRGNMAFDPYSDITRAEMAVALVNFVRKADPGLFVQRGVNAGALIISPGAIDYFADARRTVPRAVDTAISYAYELGITTGRADATFGPNDAVPRRNMASFITRALGHSSSARPIGLSVQSDYGTLHASVRDADHKPVPGLRVDAFYVSAARAARAFDDAGRCRSIVRPVESAGNRCAIDRLDPVTNSQGDAQFERLASARVGAGVTVWVWMGELNDRFDYELDLDDWVEFDQGPVSSPNAADRAVVLPSQATTPHVRFGDSIEFNLQLQYLDDRRTAGDGDDVYKTTAAGVNSVDGAEYDFVYAVFDGVATELIFDMDNTRELRILTARGYDDEDPVPVPTTTVNGAETALVAEPFSTARGHVLRSPKETLTTDGDGRLTFHLSTHDPSPAGTNDYRTVAYVLIPQDNAPAAPGGARAHHGWAVFSEAGPYLSGLSADARFSYDQRAESGDPTGNRVTVAALNQYHEPLGRLTVELASNRNHDTNGDGDFGDEAVDRRADDEYDPARTTGIPGTLQGNVDMVDPAVDGNEDGDTEDLGTDINGDGDYEDTDCFDVNGDGDTEDRGEFATDINEDGDVDTNEGCRLDVPPADAIADSSDISVDGYDADGMPNDDVFVSRFPGARATSGRSGTAQFAFSHMYDAGDPHSPGNVGNNRETITATPASDTGPPTTLRRVRGVMRFGIFVAGTIGDDDSFTADDGNAANPACMSGSYEYYANIVHVDDDDDSEISSGIPIDDDYAGEVTFGDFAGITAGAVTFVANDIVGVDADGDGDFDDDGDTAPGRTPNQVDPTREADVMSGRCAMTTIDWHMSSTNRGSGGERDILSGSLDSREIVVHWGDTGSAGDLQELLLAVPRLVRYDDNDVFENLDSPGDIIEIADFEGLLAQVVDPSNPDPSSGTLQWRYYDHRDRDDRTLFQIQLTPIGN